MIDSLSIGTLTQGKMAATSLHLMDGSHFSITGRGLTPVGQIIDKDGVFIDPTKSDLLTRALTITTMCNMALVCFLS